ncbi:hypothetical protein WA158_004291 [Blastocystis sp. Blastoise]
MRFLILISALFLVELQASTLIKSDLSGNIVHGLYYIDITVGSQKNPAKMFLELANGVSYLNAKTCSGCSHASSNPYDMNNSTTMVPISCGSSLCTPNTCTTSDCAGDCHASTNACCAKNNKSLCGFSFGTISQHSAYGSMIQENIMIQTTTGWSPSFPIYVGYLESAYGSIDSSDGLLGLSYQKFCNPSCFDNYFDSMIKNINGTKSMFTICFGNTKGVLSYGGIDEDLYTGNITWIDIFLDGYYTLEVNDFRINGKSEPLYTLFDIGTTLILLQTDLFNSIKNYFQTNYCHLPYVCDKPNIFSDECLDDPPSSEWPTLDIYLNGVYLSLSPEVYFLKYTENNTNYYCFGIRDIGHHGLDANVFGATMMRAFTTIFDKEHDRIGIATPTSACHLDVLGSIHKTTYKPSPPKDNTFIIIILISCLVFITLCSIVIIIKRHHSHRVPRLNGEHYTVKNVLIAQSRKNSEVQMLSKQQYEHSTETNMKTNLIPSNATI